MPRPTAFNIVASDAKPDGGIMIWVDCTHAATTVRVCINLSTRALDNRKLVYGWAELHQPWSDLLRENVGPPVVVETTPAATALAIGAIIAEHLDRFETTGFDWTTFQSPPIPPVTAPFAPFVATPVVVVPVTAPPLQPKPLVKVPA